MVSGLRKTGIDVLGDASWGTHFCQFYQTREDLLDILVPYFRTGLENNEFCMWVTSAPLGKDEATKALRGAVPDLDGYLSTGQIEILPHTEWYLKDGAFDAQRVLNGWVDKLNGALAAEFEGARLTGNTHWLEEADWGRFADYEQQINDVIGNHRMLVMCSYGLDRCGAAKILEVVGTHQFALIRRAGKWAIIESPERKQAAEALRDSEENFRLLVDGVIDYAIFMLDPDGIVISWNKAAHRIKGYEPDEIIGKHFSVFFPPEDVQAGKPQQELKTAVEQGRFEEEGRRVRKDGSTFQANVVITPVRDETGQLRGFAKVTHDITERKRAEEEIRRIKESYDRIIDNADEVIFRVEAAGGHVVYANPAAERLLGYSQEEWSDDPALAFKIIHPDYAAEQKRVIEEINTTKKTIKNAVLGWVAKDGREIIIEYTVIPILDEEGNIVCFESIGRDITDRKCAEEALHLAAQRWQTTFDGVANAVCLLDTQANVMQCNSAMAELAGRRPEDCVGLNCCELVHGSPQYLEGCPFQRASSSLRRETTELAVADRWLQVTVDPLKDDEGKLTGAVHVVADITERKRAEEEIVNLAKFPAENPDPVLRVSGDGTITLANKAALPLLDAWSCQEDQALPKEWAELVSHVLVSGRREDVEIDCDGRTFLVTFAPVVEAGYVNLYGHDITNRKRAEESLGLSHVCLEVANKERDTVPLLREFVAEVQAFTRCAAVGIRLLDESGNIPYEAHTGFSERFYESESPLSIKSDKCMCINVVKGDTDPGFPFYTEGGSFYMNATTDFLATVSQEDKGQTRSVCNEFGYESVALVPIASEGHIVGLIHVADPKENMVPLEAVKVLEETALQLGTAVQRVAAEQDVRRSHKELRALAARLQTAREEERIRLARRIHDDVGHNLAALKRELAWLGGKLPKAAGAPRTPNLGDRLESMSKLLAETIQTARETASDLRPGLLDDVGLAAAIEWEAKQFQRRTGVKCRFTDTAEQTQFDHEQSTALFRICQELLTNIANHAGATAVTIALKKQADELILEVSDNGKGIRDKQISSSRSLGILGMRERALVLGGEFSICGKPGKGTTATVQIPLGAPKRQVT